MQGLGRVSYPWYLWHWPILILAPLVLTRLRFTWVTNLGLMVLALGLAFLTHYLLERPLGQFPLHKATWLRIGILISVTTVAFAYIVGVRATSALEAAGQKGAANPHLSSTNRSLTNPLATGPNSGPVIPSVLSALNDTPHYPASCIVPFSATTSPKCLIGLNGSPTYANIGTDRVVLLGDSHAGEWYPDVFSLARSEGWDTEVLNKEGCPLPTITVINPTLNRPYVECNEWRSNMINRLFRRASAPDHIRRFSQLLHEHRCGGRMANHIDGAPKIGAPIVYLHDTPYPNFDVPTCVSGALSIGPSAPLDGALPIIPIRS